MIQLLLGLLATFGNHCPDCFPGDVSCDCMSEWDGMEYDFDGDGVIGVNDIFYIW